MFKNYIRTLLGLFADFVIKINRYLGSIYTSHFSYLGTSWYDHRYDYLRGTENFHWMERAFWVLPMISDGNAVLDLGCGDGIFSGVFYSSKAKEVIAVDKDITAINHARTYYSRKNVSYIKQDVRKLSFGNKKFDLILMFAVIEHFTPDDGVKVLTQIGHLLKTGGIFFGSTPIFSKDKKAISNFEHQNEFTSSKDLYRFLKKSFKLVKIFHSTWRFRDECYFRCEKPLSE